MYIYIYKKIFHKRMVKTNTEIYVNAKLVSQSRIHAAEMCFYSEETQTRIAQTSGGIYKREKKSGSCSTASHINRRGTRVVWTGIYFRSRSGRFLSLFPFFHPGETGTRFSIFASPRNPTFYPSFSRHDSGKY